MTRLGIHLARCIISQFPNTGTAGSLTCRVLMRWLLAGFPATSRRQTRITHEGNFYNSTCSQALFSLIITCQAKQMMSCWKMTRFWMLPLHVGIFETSFVTHNRSLTIQLELCVVIGTRALYVIVLVTTVYETGNQFQVVWRCQVSQQNGNNGYRMATAAATQQSVL